MVHPCQGLTLSHGSMGWYGTKRHGASETAHHGTMLGPYAAFPLDIYAVEVRISVSFISVEQARRNVDTDIPDGTPREQTAGTTNAAWTEKLDQLRYKADRERLEIFFSALFHILQVFII
jgi:putative alpha-1,2-mannosidase